VRVWQPQGFEGLELTELDSENTLHFNSYLTAFTVGVRLHGVRRTRYRRADAVTPPQSYIVYQPGEVLKATPLGGERYSYKSMSLSAPLLDALLRETAKASSSAFAFQMISSHRRLNEHLVRTYLACHTSFTGDASRLEKETRLLKLVEETLQCFADASPSRSPSGREHRAVSLIRDYLNDHPTQDVALDDLSALTGLNKWYLVELFKQHVGVTPHQYQTVLRITLAKKLLRAGLPGTQVALEAGFADQSHFTRVFKKYTWVTPGRYQRDCLP